MIRRAHILGICGTFMGSLAVALKQSGWHISGSDKAAYPPMSDVLAEHNITVLPYDISLACPDNGLMVIGNSLSRGHPMVERILDQQLNYTSGPALLATEILAGKRVIAISGTHGKTTTSAMLAWILTYAGLNPGFLIGGKPGNFSSSARVTESHLFVIEADEYDTAFFDKRSKFVHYRPHDLLIHNLEYDHVDIFPDLKAIQTQFHHLVRTVPPNGNIVWHGDQPGVAAVLAAGCWSRQTKINDEWQLLPGTGPTCYLYRNGRTLAGFDWNMQGEHNRANALASIVLAEKNGICWQQSIEALQQFQGVARRQQLLYAHKTEIYDDFAHHPTAIAKTLAALHRPNSQGRLIAVVHLASNSMRSGAHTSNLASALHQADCVLMYQTQGNSLNARFMDECSGYDSMHSTESSLLERLGNVLLSGDRLVIMSNGNPGTIREQIVELAQSIDSQVD